MPGADCAATARGMTPGQRSRVKSCADRRFSSRGAHNITVPAFHGIREFDAQHDTLLLQRCDPGLQLCRELRGMCLRGRSAVTVHAQLRSGIRGGSLDLLLSCVFQALCLLSHVIQVPLMLQLYVAQVPLMLQL